MLRRREPDHSVLFIHAGQCGVQWGSAQWELFGLEHGIDPSGHVTDVGQPAGKDVEKEHLCIYEETSNNKSEKKYVPRSVWCDLESGVIDQVRCGAYRSLFHPSDLVTGMEDAANNFARGFYSVGRSLIPQVVDRVRANLERMDSVRGCMLEHSIGGGTGSGFCALILGELKDLTEKTTFAQFTVVPSNQLTSAIVEPYNALLHFQASYCTNFNILFDNEALYNLCKNCLQLKRPSFTHCNRLLAHVISNALMSERHNGLLNVDLDGLRTNLCPYPELHFPMASMAPIFPAGRDAYEDLSAQNLISEVFNDKRRMASAPSRVMLHDKELNHCTFATAMLFRGDFHPREVNTVLNTMKMRYESDDWNGAPFKVGICKNEPTVVPFSGIGASNRTVTKLHNTTAVTQVLHRLYSKFSLLYSQRAFVFWYKHEGIEDGDWDKAKDHTLDLLRDYVMATYGHDIWESLQDMMAGLPINFNLRDDDITEQREYTLQNEAAASTDRSTRSTPTSKMNAGASTSRTSSSATQNTSNILDDTEIDTTVSVEAGSKKLEAKGPAVTKMTKLS